MKQFDERDTMFSRVRLIPGTKRYQEYYLRFPDRKAPDDEIREFRANKMSKEMSKSSAQSFRIIRDVWKILAPSRFFILRKKGSRSEIPFVSKDQSGSSNELAEITRQDMQKAAVLHKSQKKKPPARKQVKISPDQASEKLKEMIRCLGIEVSGIARINPEMHYTHYGTHADGYGKKVNLDYQFAIVLAAPLNKERISKAPFFEAMMVAMKGYADTCTASAQVALYIKKLGYDAVTDNFLGYHSPLVPIAQSAGIGQLGRCNFIVNPVYGNRMKMGAVLTNLPLVEDEPVNFGLREFCTLCGKCAGKCPAQAISADDPAFSDGMWYWSHNEAACMRMWEEVETDCGICMASCPFSQGIDQEIVRSMNGNKKIMQRAAALNDRSRPHE